MNELKLFENPEFGNVRTIETNDGNVMFCGTDIAKALGYNNAPDAIQKHCRKDGIAKCDSVDSRGRKNTLTFINEGNVYRLITHSKLPNAERFEKWVFEEVLPSIRKHGAYMTASQITVGIIRAAMGNADISVPELAKSMFVHANTIYADLRDPERIPQNRLWMYFTVLGVPVDDALKRIADSFSQTLAKR